MESSNELIKELTDELMYFFNGFSSWESSVIKSSELTVSEAHSIEILEQYGEMSMKDLARKLGVSTGTTTVTVDRLEKKDYAQRKPTKEDRRVTLISLTEKGIEAAKEHRKYHIDLTEQMISSISKDEADQLINILKKINSDTF